MLAQKSVELRRGTLAPSQLPPFGLLSVKTFSAPYLWNWNVISQFVLAGILSEIITSLTGTTEEWQFCQDLDDWSRCDLLDSNTCWVVSPHFGRQCMLQAMYAWTESPWNSSHLFILPRVMQRDFGRISKFIAKVGESWLIPLSFTPVVPFIVYYLPPFNRISSFLSKSDKLEYRLDAAAPTYTPVWIKKQVEALQRM